MTYNNAECWLKQLASDGVLHWYMLVGDLLDYSLEECPSRTPIHFSAGSGICPSGEVAGVSFPTCSMTYGTNRHHASKFSCQSLDPENPSLKCVVCGGSASWRRKMGAISKLTLPLRRVQGGCWRILLPSNFCLFSAFLHLPQVQIPDSKRGIPQGQREWCYGGCISSFCPPWAGIQWALFAIWDTAWLRSPSWEWS